MTAIIILIVISLTLATMFLLAFLWAVRSNQYEDTFTPSIRILTDDVILKTENKNIRINRES